jgi:predicted nucleotide-binding protein
MSLICELRIDVDAFHNAVLNYKKNNLFDPIKSYVEKLHKFVNGKERLTKNEFEILTNRINDFFDGYEDTSSGSSASGIAMIYRPPTGILQNKKTVNNIIKVSNKIIALDDSEYNNLILTDKGDPTPILDKIKHHCIFIGHGRSKLWSRVNSMLADELNLKTNYFERESHASQSIIPILEGFLNEATFAILVMTAEDETSEGTIRARQNVIHEAGLFQGRLGFNKVVILKQEGLENFSNVDGLQYIPFSGDSIEQTFYELQRVLKREGLIN